jgi:hypothetical protein
LRCLNSIASSAAQRVFAPVREVGKRAPTFSRSRCRAYLNLWRNFSSIPRIPF